MSIFFSFPIWNILESKFNRWVSINFRDEEEEEGDDEGGDGEEEYADSGDDEEEEDEYYWVDAFEHKSTRIMKTEPEWEIIKDL